MVKLDQAGVGVELLVEGQVMFGRMHRIMR